MKDVLKKNKTIIVSIILLVFMLSLLMINNRINVKKYDGVVKVNEVKINTKGSSTEKEIIKKDDKEVVKEKETISSYSVLKYKINYKLETEGNTKRDALIYVNLKDEDKKYIVIKDINENNISSKMNGNTFEILVKNVETNINHSLEIEVTINNAPNGYKFSPEIVVKEKTSPETKKSVNPVEVKTTSLEGFIKTTDGKVAKNIEVKACIIDKDVCLNEKITYTDENGKYVFSNLDEGVYRIILPDGYIVDENEANVDTGSNELNIVYDQKGRFSASIKKYLEKVKIGDKNYDIAKSQKVAIPILSKNYIVADYVFDIENISESDGYVKVIRETIPEGFKVSDSEINKDWKKDGNYYVNDTLKNDILTSGETREVRIQIESTSKVGADVYKNKVEILGESYHTVRYVLDDELYKEFEIADGDKLENYKVEKENYRFSGWYTDKNYTNKYNFNNLVTKDITVYGKLINTVIPKRKITYMSDDTTIFDEREIDDGDCAEDIEGPVKEGYTFKYWKKDGEKYFDSTICKPVHDDIILYSEDEINKYDVNYYIPGSLNEESGNYIFTGVNTKYDDFSSKVDYGTNITNPGSKELKYYNFKGWFKEDTYDNEVEYPLEIKNDTNIYGKYQIKKYTVEFYNDRADDEPFNTTVFNATTIFTAPETEAPEGYKVKGWEYEDGSNVTFGDVAGETFADYSEDDVIKVYRVIGGITFRVRYLDYDNELIDENAYEDVELYDWPSKLYDYEDMLHDDNYREGYRFKGFTFNGEDLYSTYYDGTHDYFSDLCIDKNDCVLDLIADYDDLSNMPVYVVFFDKMGTNGIETPKGELFDKTKIPAFTGVPGPWSGYSLPNRFTPIDWYEIVMENGSPVYGTDGYEHYDEPFDFDNTVINETTYVTAVYNPYKYILRFNKTDDSIQGEMTDQIVYMNTNDYSFSPYSTPNERLWVNPKNNEFVKPGHTFKGWSTTPGGEIEVYSGSSMNVFKYEDDDHKIADGEYLINLYPVFEEAEYTIFYSNNGGYGSMARTIFKAADAENGTLTKSTFTKAGNRFAGWSINYGVSDVDFADEEPLTSLMNYMDEHSTNFLWIYAQYRPNTYTVKFLKSDEDVQGEMEDQLFNYGESKKLSKNLYTKEGYDFVGWENGNITYTDEQEVSNLASEDGAVVELTSKFEIKKYKVIFMNNNLEYEVQNDVTYGSNITPPSTNPTLDNKVFVGWKLNGEDNFFNFNDRVANDDIAEEIDGENVIILVSYYSNIEPPIINTEPTEWTNDKVKITLSNDKGYDMKVKIGDSSYTDYSEPVYTEENTRVKGKNISGLEESGEAIKDIDNIDKIEPSISNFESIGNSRYVSISLDTFDEDSGINTAKIILNVGSEEVTYCNISTDKEVINDKQTGPYTYSYYCDIDGLSESTTYTGKVVLTDVAGNVTEDDIEVTTSDITDIVARIISYDGVDIEDPENYINYPSLKDALIGCDEVSQTKKCTIQMVKNTRETNIINSDQNILLDLNGHEIDGVSANTFIINGKLQIVDHSNTYDENDPETLTSYEPIGKIINNHITTKTNENNEEVFVHDGVTILNNSTGTFILGENEVSDDEPGSVVSQDEPEIVSNYLGVNNSKGGTFKFYDGQVTSDVATIRGYTNSTPYLYNVNVNETDKVRANLVLLTTAVARIERTNIYYSSLDSARDEANNGKYLVSNIGPVSNLVGLLEHGVNSYNYFELTEMDGETVITDADISNNEPTRSFIKIDLTDFEYNQLLTISSKLTGSSLENNKAVAAVVDSESTYTERYTNYSYSDEYLPTTTDLSKLVSSFMVISGNTDLNDYSYYLEKGKVYYLYIVHDKDDPNDKLIINNISLKSDTTDYSSHNFDTYKDFSTTGITSAATFKWNNNVLSNSGIKNYSNAYSRYVIDTSNYDEPVEITVRAGIEDAYNYSSTKKNTGYVIATESRTIDKTNPDTNDGIILSIKDTVKSQNYSAVLQPNKTYYLHFLYRYYSNSNYKKDYFFIENVKLNGNSLFNETTYEDKNYITSVNVPVLNTEIEAPNTKPADTIQMVKNIDLTSSFDIEDTRDVVLDINGHNLKGSINNNGKLKIIDSKYSEVVSESQRLAEEQQAIYDAEYLEDLSNYEDYLDERNAESTQTYYEELSSIVSSINNNTLYTKYDQNMSYLILDKESGLGDTQWDDLTGNNHNADITGFEKENGGLEFNGEDKSTSLGAFTESDFSVNLIFSTNKQNENQYLLSNFNESNKRGFYIKINENNKLEAGCYNSSSTLYTIESTESIIPNKIYNITFVSDSSNRIIKLYIFNKQVASYSSIFTYNNYNTKNLLLGSNSNNDYFKGVIYSLKIYKNNEFSSNNFNIDKLKYDFSYINDDKSDGVLSSSANSDCIYKLFDNDYSTIYTTSNHDSIKWQKTSETTIKSFRIYGSNNSIAFPKKVSFYGSKDGKQYNEIIIDKTLSPKGLNEYEEVIISENLNNLDSYKYYKWTFDGDSNIEISEIKLEEYFVSRNINSFDNGEMLSDKTIDYDGYNYKYTYSANGSIMMYYSKIIKVTTRDVNVTFNFKNSNSNGTLYYGFALPSNKDSYNFAKREQLSIKSIANNTLTTSISDPGEYYFKIYFIASSYSGNFNLSNLVISDKPVKQNVSASDLPIDSYINTSYGLINNKNAYLELENVVVRLTAKGSSSSSYSSAIKNSGRFKLGKNAIIKLDQQYDTAITNQITGVLLPSEGTISGNISNSSYNKGIIDYSTDPENSIDGFTFYGVLGISFESKNTIDVKNIKNLTTYMMNMAGSGTVNVNNIQNESPSFINFTKSGTVNLNNDTYNGFINISGTGLLNINNSVLDCNIYEDNESTASININNSTFNVTNASTMYTSSRYSLTMDGTGDLTVRNSQFNTPGGGIATISNNILINNIEINSSESSLLINSGDSDNINISDSKLNVLGIGTGIIVEGVNSTINLDNININSRSKGIDLKESSVINIKGNSVIEAGSDGINTTAGIVNLGNKDNIARNNYPKIKSSGTAVNSFGDFNFYDGRLVGKINNSFTKINELEDNYDVNVEQLDSYYENVTMALPVLKDDESNAVAKIGNKKYVSLKDAVLDLDNSNKTIEIISDIVTANTAIIPENINGTIDLNGHVIRLFASDGLIMNNGSISFKDSGNGLITAYSNNIFDNSGTLNIDSGLFELNENSYFIKNTGVLNVKNNTDFICIANKCNGINSNNGTNNITESSFTVGGDLFVGNNNSSFIINGGSYDSAYILILDETSNMTINYGTFNGAGISNDYQYRTHNLGNITINETENKETVIKQSIYVNKGNLIINGGNVNIDFYSWSRGYVEVNGGTVKDIYATDVLVVGGSVEKIQGDNFTIGVKDAVVDQESPIITNIYNYSNDKLYWYDGQIKSYNTAPTEIESGYEIKVNDNGYKYLDRLHVAQIDDEKFYSLEEAFGSDLCDNQACTIKLLEDLSFISTKESIIISDTQEITFNLNGHTIVSEGADIFINNGIFNIVDSTGNSNLRYTYDEKRLGLSMEQIPVNNAILNNGTMNINVPNTSIIDPIKNNGSLVIDSGNIYLLSNIGDSSTIINNGLFSRTIILKDNSTLTIEDGTFNNTYTDRESYDYYIEYKTKIINIDNASASAIIHGGTFSFANTKGSITNRGNLTIESINNVIELESIDNYTYNVEGVVNFISGKIKNVTTSTSRVAFNIGKKDGVLSTSSPEINSIKGNYNFYDGKIYNIVYEHYPMDIDDNYSFIKETDSNNDEYYTLGNSSPFKVNNNLYTTLSDAITSGCTSNNCEIELVSNAYVAGDIDTAIIPANKNVIIDFKQYELTTGNKTLIENNGTLTFKSDLDGGPTKSDTNIINNKGTLNINLGTVDYRDFSDKNYYNYENSGTININSLNFSSQYGLIFKNSGIINLNDNVSIAINQTYSAECIRNLENGVVNVKGATINAKNRFIHNEVGSELDVTFGSISGEIKNYGILNFNEEDGKNIVVNGNITSEKEVNYNGSINERAIVNITGGSYKSSGKTLHILGGKLTINSGSFESTDDVPVYAGYSSWYSNFNYSNVNVNGGSYKGATSCFENSRSSLNIRNVNIGVNDCPIGVNGSGSLHIYESTNIHVSNIAIVGNSVILGEEGLNPSTTSPTIFGENKGISGSSLYFYDGRVIGKTNFSIDPSTTVHPLEGYEERILEGTGEFEGYEVTILYLAATVIQEYEFNGQNFSNLQTAFNSAIPEQENTLKLHKNVVLESNITVPDDATVIIDKNGYDFDTNGFTFVGNNIAVRFSDGTNLLGTIRDLLNINPISIRKDIIVFADNTGNKLSSAEEYTLLYNNGGTFEEIDIKADSVPGRFIVTSSSSNDKIVSYNGSVTINNIPDGEYKLIGDNGSVSTFKIENDGSLSGNIRTSYLTDTYTSNNILASSEAKMIVNLRTGNKYVRYGLIAGIIGLLLACFIYMKKMVRN